MMLDFIGSLIMVAVLIGLVVLSVKEQKQKKKLHEERIIAQTNLEKSYKKMIVALDNLKVDAVEYESIKRWITVLSNRLGEHTELIEQHTKEVKTVFTPSIIIKDGTDVDIEMLQNDIAKSGIFSIPEDATIEPIETIKTSTLETLREHVESQGMPGNWNRNEYMRGAYNGMELMLATIENRKPVFKGKHDYGKGEVNNEQ